MVPAKRRAGVWGRASREAVALRPQPFQTCGGRRGAKRQVWRAAHDRTARYRKEHAMLWKGFQRPKRLDVERDTLTDRFGRFHAQPFERGFGTTVGNALRR